MRAAHGGAAGPSWSRPQATAQAFRNQEWVELKDARLMMFIRTTLGSQYLSWSGDGGETWSPARPSEILSPLSPASIKRIPKTGDLLMVWNDHAGIDPALRDKRTPLTVAISRDEGKTWIHKHNLLDDPDGWYCYYCDPLRRRACSAWLQCGRAGLGQPEPHIHSAVTM